MKRSTTEARSTRRLLRDIPRGLFVCVVLVFLMSSCTPQAGVVVDTPTPTAGPTFTATATIDWFPATPTPTPPATRAPMPTPDLRLGVGALLWEDDFGDKSSFRTTQSVAGSVAYGNNELTLALPAVKGSLVSLRKDTLLRDFYLEINASASLCKGTDNYGLALRTASEQDFYRFLMTCEGNLRLERLRGGGAEVVQDWIAGASRPGAVRIGVWAVGSEMRFFLDGVHQFTARDPLYPEGGLGVVARSNGDKALTVNFSDLKVYAVEPGG